MKRPPNDVAALEGAIEQSHQDIATTIAALQTQLQPRLILQHVRDSLVDGARATTQQTGDTISQVVQDLGTSLQARLHDAPLVAAVMGLTLTWITTLGHQAEAAAKVGGEQIHTALDEASATAQRLGDQMRAGLDKHTQQARAEAKTGRDHVAEAASASRQEAGEKGQAAKAQLAETMSQLEQTLRAHPWLVASLSVAVGVALGLAMPETSQERHLVSQARDAVGQRVQSALHDTVKGFSKPR